MQLFISSKFRCNILLPISSGTSNLPKVAYKVRQMDMTFRVQQHIVGLEIPMHDTLLVYISQGASQLGHPKAYGLFGKGLARNVKS